MYDVNVSINHTSFAKMDKNKSLNLLHKFVTNTDSTVNHICNAVKS